ncbi:ribonuclease P protein component [Candidatus Nomurabacteria bacterium]|nr:ribonuclease P protein component [Candidatus Nomurabacteria bacterium]
MLPKKNRADKKTVENIFKGGKFINSSHFTFKFIPIPEPKRFETKISFIVPKSVSKLAVKRNKLKRLGYRILEKQPKNSIPLVYGVFIFKTRPNGRGLSVGWEYQDDLLILENEIKEIFNKVH